MAICGLVIFELNLGAEVKITRPVLEDDVFRPHFRLIKHERS
jgi:hypothetical protein